jgi:uncharacterized 2Fe-2S/4Fe-4S cluster protein (DUF4445 family)
VIFINTILNGNGELISELLRGAGEILALPCGGRGVCGGCIVYVKGAQDEPCQAERDLIYSKHPVKIKDFTARLACACHVFGEIEIISSDEAVTVVTRSNSEIPDYDGHEKKSLGIAADIGTTTVVLELYDLESKKLLGVETALNPQTSIGSDVLSRIEYAVKFGIDEPCDLIRGKLAEMLRSIIKYDSFKNSYENIRRVVITGNTTMLHFLMGLDPSGIGAAPFKPSSLFGEVYPADRIFPFLRNAEMYIPPCISAYVGADIACGLLCVDRKGKTLFVDIGTNGEMAVIGEDILCAATAAGPAFEGAGISMGVLAVPGAIYDVFESDRSISSISCKTIANAPPIGICGTGLISTVDLMLKLGILDESGYLEEPFKIVSEVYISPKDIRELQLAKAAIAAGIGALLKKSETEIGDIDALVLSGGFGSFLDPQKAAGIGLIPKELAQKTMLAGNTALRGAVKTLFSRRYREQLRELCDRAKEIPLSGSGIFEELFIECINLSPLAPHFT